MTMESPVLPTDPHVNSASSISIVTNQDITPKTDMDQHHRAMLNLVIQPLEVLHQILCYVDVQDLANLNLTCRMLHDFIARDDLLWRRQYMNMFDEPLEYPTSWQKSVKKLMHMRKLLRGDNIGAKDDALEDVANTSIDLLTSIRTSQPKRNQDYLIDLLSTRRNKSAFLSRSTLFRRAGLPSDLPADTEELCQLSAKLHVYYGMEIEPSLSEVAAEVMEQSLPVHSHARSRIYDLRRYKRCNFWGPFTDDGTGQVDWEKVQAIMIVLTRGLRIFSQRVQGGLVGLFWNQPFHGLAAHSFTSLSLRERMGLKVLNNKQDDEFKDLDPYGVRGTWMRVVNFLDYHDLFDYNFQPPFPPDDEERPPITTKEAIRLIKLKLKVSRVEKAGEHSDPESHPDHPIVHFVGTSYSVLHHFDINGNSKIRGFVRTTPHGAIRWTTFSIINGEERWRSESVQIGGIKSARGAIGNWFDCNYDEHGPAGPTAFWKLSDEVEDEDGGDEEEEEEETEDGEEGEWEETEDDGEEGEGEDGNGNANPEDGEEDGTVGTETGARRIFGHGDVSVIVRVADDGTVYVERQY